MNFLIEDKRPVSFLGGFPPPPGKGSSTSECFRLARSARCVWSWLDCWEAFRVLSLIFMGTTWKAIKGKTRNTYSLRKHIKLQLLNPRNYIMLVVLRWALPSRRMASLTAQGSYFSESTTLLEEQMDIIWPWIQHPAHQWVWRGEKTFLLRMTELSRVERTSCIIESNLWTNTPCQLGGRQLPWWKDWL